MHMAMFAASFYIDVSPYTSIDPNSSLTTVELRAFYYLRWGHFASFLVQMLAMQLKEHKLHFYSKIFQACQIGTYMIPQIFEQWIYRNIRNFNNEHDELFTEVRRWFYLEESVFFS